MNKKTGFLLLTIFLDMVGIGILIPVIPQLLGEPSSPYYLLSASQGDWGFILLGLLMASYPLALFFAAPVLGALSDKYGRKPVLVLSLLGTGLSYFIFAFAIITKNIPMLFVSRLIDGATGGNISVAQAALADMTEPKDRPKVFGMMGAAFGLGFIFGPFLGGILSSPSVLPFFSASTPFFFSGILALFNTVSIYYLFSESIKEKQLGTKIHFFSSIENIMKANKFHDVRYLFLVGFLFNAGFAFFTTFFNVYLTNKFAFSSADIGNFFAYVGIWIIFTQLLVVRNISKKWNETQLLGPAFIMSSIGILLYLVPQVSWMLLFVVPLASIPNGIQFANFSSLLTKKTDDKMRGEVLGINSSVTSLGQALPPVFAGAIAALTASYVPVVIASLIVFSAGLVFIYKVKRHKDTGESARVKI
jgi:DHA1 family tetracycline resistance protein-like MFS transporter